MRKRGLTSPQKGADWSAPLDRKEEESLSKVTAIARAYRSIAVLILFMAGSILCAGFASAQPETLGIIDSSEDPLTLHPNRAFDPNSCVVIGQIFEGLLDYNCVATDVNNLLLLTERGFIEVNGYEELI